MKINWVQYYKNLRTGSRLKLGFRMKKLGPVPVLLTGNHLQPSPQFVGKSSVYYKRVVL